MTKPLRPPPDGPLGPRKPHHNKGKTYAQIFGMEKATGPVEDPLAEVLGLAGLRMNKCPQLGGKDCALNFWIDPERIVPIIYFWRATRDGSDNLETAWVLKRWMTSKQMDVNGLRTALAEGRIVNTIRREDIEAIIKDYEQDGKDRKTAWRRGQDPKKRQKRVPPNPFGPAPPIGIFPVPPPDNKVLIVAPVDDVCTTAPKPPTVRHTAPVLHSEGEVVNHPTDLPIESAHATDYAIAHPGNRGISYQQIYTDPLKILEGYIGAGFTPRDKFIRLAYIAKFAEPRDSIRAIELIEQQTEKACNDLGLTRAEITRALLQGDWSVLAEKTLAKAVAEGDMDALKIAITSGKVSNLKIPESGSGSTVNQLTVEGNLVTLSEEKQRRMADLDDLLMLPADFKVTGSKVEEPRNDGPGKQRDTRQHVPDQDPAGDVPTTDGPGLHAGSPEPGDS